MKKYTLTTVCVLALAALCQIPAFAQWDYGQESTWNMIEHRAEMRRMEERMKARREEEKKQKAKSAKSPQGKGKSNASSAKKKQSAKTVNSPQGKVKGNASSAKSVALTKKVAPPVKSYGVWFYRDTFQDFPFEDGYRVNLNFVSTATGKTFPRFAYYDTWQGDEDIWDVPAGSYTIRAEAIQKGKKYPVHLAVIQGSREEAPFETFTASLKIQLKPIVTIGGKYVPDDKPLKLYVRVIQ